MIEDVIYGVTFKSNDGVYDGVDRLLTDEKKVEIIKNIQRANNGTNNVIYFGDGLTDKFAFEYVHKIGGKSVFITTNPKSQEVYKNLNANGIIDEIFQADYSTSSDISRFIQREIELEKNQER